MVALVVASGVGAARERSDAAPRPPAIEVFPLGCCTHSALGQLVLEPDHNVWWSDWTNGDRVGYITPAGVVKTFHFKGTSPRVLGTGPGGYVWFTGGGEGAEVHLYRIRPNGTGLKKYPFTPQWCIYCDASALVLAGGRLIAEGGFAPTYAVTADGAMTVLAQDGGTPGILGSDGHVWWLHNSGENYVARLDPGTGMIDKYSAGLLPASTVGQFTVGPDKNVWFTETNHGMIARVRPGGEITEFPLPHGVVAVGLAPGPDGNLWFTEGPESTKIGRMTLTGHVTEFPLPPGAAGGINAVRGADHKVWIALNATGQIGRITPNAACVVPNLVGKGLAKAKALLAGAHCKLGAVARAPGTPATAGQATLKVAETSPPAGFGLTSRGKVGVTLHAA